MLRLFHAVTWRRPPVSPPAVAGPVDLQLVLLQPVDPGERQTPLRRPRRRTFVAGGPDWLPGTITDDTQMTLFTVEGLIRAGVRTDRGIGFTVAVVHHAYDRWLDTQLLPGPSGQLDGWLQAEQWLYARRAPGNTCLSALTDERQGGDAIQQFGGQADNNSKGCGGVMRVAPLRQRRPPATPTVTRPASSPPAPWR
jgi:ADP-ribosylglycohydrolase